MVAYLGRAHPHYPALTTHPVVSVHIHTAKFLLILTCIQCALIALDYKLNFQPDKAEDIPALQERVAQRVYDLLTSNGGLYIKIGACSSTLPCPRLILLYLTRSSIRE